MSLSKSCLYWYETWIYWFTLLPKFCLYCKAYIKTIIFGCIKQVSGKSRAPRSNPQRLSWDWYENDVWWSVIGRRMAHDWHENDAWLALNWHGTGVRWVWDWGETVEATLWIYCVLLKNIITQRLFLIWCHHRGKGSNNKAFPYLINKIEQAG